MNLSPFQPKSYTRGVTCYQNDNISTGRITCTPGAGCYQNDNICTGRISYTSGVKSDDSGSVAIRSKFFDTTSSKISGIAEAQSDTGGITFGYYYPKLSYPLPEPISGGFIFPPCCRAFQSYFSTEVSS